VKTLNETDVAYILAGLRCFQERLEEDGRAGSVADYFDGLDKPEPEYIDVLCLSINLDYEGAPRATRELLEIISGMTQSGEDVDGEPFEMSGDDAIDTLNNVISRARELLK